ncbi:S8 family serine peptidase [Xanthomonas sacchari]|uniref:S8 family serine peptidase n=1 Tax=Xanthomonas sacchari TaxID=56458 RepID=UPI00058200B1|nr:S8 family serine peptidase [Xanthomonas sacchari]AJC46305.1 protease [Xanthomonas sacchari]
MTHISLHPRNFLAVALGMALASTAQAQPVSRYSMLEIREPNQPIRSVLYDGLIVTYRDGSSERRDVDAAMRTLKQLTSSASVAASWSRSYRQSVPVLHHVRRLATGGDLVRFSRKLSQSQLETLMERLRADPAIAYVEPNVQVEADRGTTPATASVGAQPDDPLYPLQWHLRAPDGQSETAVTKGIPYANRGGIDVLPAWQYGTGQGVVVAVLDTGITQHPDLDTSLADAGYDFISNALSSGRASDGRAAGGWDTGNWNNEDKYLLANGGCIWPSIQESSTWHGTHVAGTIAARTNNGIGVAGVAPDARILPVRVLGHCGGDLADINDAIVWAAGGHVDGVPDNANPAEVINMSLGVQMACHPDSSTARAIAQANALGSVVVVAAGNENLDTSRFLPASCPGVINVAATGLTGERAPYSNYGSLISLSAPGGSSLPGGTIKASVWSTFNDGDQGPGQPSYGGMDGTSMAAPHVSGVAALAISAAIGAGRPMPSSAELRDLLTQTSTPLLVKQTLPIGAGILNAARAVARAAGASVGVEANAVAIARGRTDGLSAGAGTSPLYRLDLPSTARNLQIRTLGGSGQLALYVSAYRAPEADGRDADYRSSRNGTVQNVQIGAPARGPYFLRLAGGSGGYADVTLLVSYSE